MNQSIIIINLLISSFFSFTSYTQDNSNHVSVDQLIRIGEDMKINNKWKIVDIDFIDYENDIEKDYENREYDALLIFHYQNSEENSKNQIVYISLNRINNSITDYTFIVSSSGGGKSQTCTGVNCAKCTLKNKYHHSAYCKCDKKATEDKAYCNHSVTHGIALTKDILHNPILIIQEAKQKL